jgi:hypothetical protein
MHRLIGAALAVLLLSPPAAAQDKTLEPNALTVQAKRPPLALNARQTTIVRDALASENTEQKSPANFQPKVGAALPASLKVDVMPQRLVQRERSLEPYGYAKLAKDILVLDPLNRTIIAVLPRLAPTSGNSLSPADWAATQGRPLTGQPPQPAGGDQSTQPAGDSGDIANGSEPKANEK